MTAVKDADSLSSMNDDLDLHLLASGGLFPADSPGLSIYDMQAFLGPNPPYRRIDMKD
jgi:hypothetical protein